MSAFPGWLPDPQPLFAPPPCVTVSIQGLDFVSGPRSRSRISLGGWDWWINGATARGGPVEWESADGGIEGDVYEDGRSIRLEGLIVERSTAALWERMEELGAVLASPRWDWMVVDEEHLGLSRQIRVCRLARPMITPLSSRLASYTLELRSAGFPRLDTMEQSVVVPAGGVDLVNAGNHPAAVTLTMRGPLTNPGLSWPGGSWVHRGSVGSGQTITVDMWRRVVRDPATSRQSRNLVVASSTDWLRLAPGTTRVSRTGTGAGSITAAWRSSWS